MAEPTTAMRVGVDALEALKLQVLRKHGKLRGALTDEATRAIRDRAQQLAADADEVGHGGKRDDG